MVLLGKGGAMDGPGRSVRFDSFADNFGDWYFGLSGDAVFGN